MKKYLVPALLAVLLSACGGGGNNDGGNNAGNTAGAGPIDAFYALILAQFSTPSDTTEPSAIDSIAVTSPENTEPVAM